MEALSRENIELFPPHEDRFTGDYRRDFSYGSQILGTISTSSSYYLKPTATVKVFERQLISRFEYKADSNTELIDAITDDETVQELIGGALIVHNIYGGT